MSEEPDASTELHSGPVARSAAEPEVEIHVRPDGSYKVYGPVRLLDVDGNGYDLGPRRKTDRIGDRIKLCRCGASKTMPFCDDSHVETGFSSEPHVSDLS